MIVDMAKEFNPVTSKGQCTVPERVEARMCQHIIFAGSLRRVVLFKKSKSI